MFGGVVSKIPGIYGSFGINLFTAMSTDAAITRMLVFRQAPAETLLKTVN